MVQLHASIYQSLNEMDHLLGRHKLLNLSPREVKKILQSPASMEGSKQVSKNSLPKKGFRVRLLSQHVLSNVHGTDNSHIM